MKPALQTKLFLLFLVTFLLFILLTACDTPISTPDPDALKFITQSEQAKQVAQKEIPDAVLRQADTDLTKTIFRFTDRAGTRAIDVTALPSDQWRSSLSTKSPLLGRATPDINIKELRLSPNRVAQAMTKQWSDCKIRTLTLFRNDSENQLTWIAFCSTSQGNVIGEINDKTGTLKPVNVPSLSIPVTATPAR